MSFAAGNFIFNALVGFSTPVVSAAFFTVGVVAGGIGVVGSRDALAGNLSVVTAVAFISAGVLVFTPDVVDFVVVLAALVGAGVGVWAVWVFRRAAEVIIGDTFS